MPNTKFINQNPRTVRGTKQSKLIKFAQKSFESFKRAVEKKVEQHYDKRENSLDTDYRNAYNEVQRVATQMNEGQLKSDDLLRDSVYNLSQIGVKLVDLELKRRLRVEKHTKAFKLNSSTLGKVSNAFRNRILQKATKIIENANTRHNYQESADKLYSAVRSNEADMDLELDRLKNYNNYSSVFRADMPRQSQPEPQQQPVLDKNKPQEAEPVIKASPLFGGNSIFTGAASKPVSPPATSATPEVKVEEPVISAEAPKPSSIFAGTAKKTEDSVITPPPVVSEVAKPAYQENPQAVIDAVNRISKVMTPFAAQTPAEEKQNAEEEGKKAGEQAFDDMLKVIEDARKNYQPQSPSTEISNSKDEFYRIIEGNPDLVPEQSTPVVTPEVKAPSYQDNLDTLRKDVTLENRKPEESNSSPKEVEPSAIFKDDIEPLITPTPVVTPEVKAPSYQENFNATSETVTVSGHTPLKEETNNNGFNTVLSDIESRIANLNKQKEDNNNRKLQIQSEIANLNEEYQKANTENAQISADLTELDERLKVANLMQQGFGVDEILTQVPQSERLKYAKIAGQLEAQSWHQGSVENNQSKKM